MKQINKIKNVSFVLIPIIEEYIVDEEDEQSITKQTINISYEFKIKKIGTPYRVRKMEQQMIKIYNLNSSSLNNSNYITSRKKSSIFNLSYLSDIIINICGK